MSKVERGKLTS